VPALVGAGASVLIARSLPFSPFFLVPIGIVALTRGALPLVLTVFLTVAINLFTVFVSIGSEVARINMVSLISDSAYFLVLVSSFSWAAYHNDESERRFFSRLSWRFVFAAIGSSLVLFPIILIARRDQSLVAFFNIQAAAIADAFKAGAGSDVVQRSLMEKEMTVESIAKTFSLVISRGAVIGHLIFFGVSWRIAFVIASFRLPSLRTRHFFMFFRNDAFLVWVLIFTLIGVMSTKMIGNEIFVAVVWNLLLLCVFLYVIQGMAIVAYNLSRPGVPVMLRPLVVFLAALIIFRPGINAAAAVALAIVGVAENWLPLRVPINNEPPSTPEA